MIVNGCKWIWHGLFIIVHVDPFTTTYNSSQSIPNHLQPTPNPFTSIYNCLKLFTIIHKLSPAHLQSSSRSLYNPLHPISIIYHPNQIHSTTIYNHLQLTPAQSQSFTTQPNPFTIIYNPSQIHLQPLQSFTAHFQPIHNHFQSTPAHLQGFPCHEVFQ